MLAPFVAWIGGRGARTVPRHFMKTDHAAEAPKREEECGGGAGAPPTHATAAPPTHATAAPPTHATE
jgi:hypothetical protein